jgi:hypothetical protein
MGDIIFSNLFHSASTSAEDDRTGVISISRTNRRPRFLHARFMLRAPQTTAFAGAHSVSAAKRRVVSAKRRRPTAAYSAPLFLAATSSAVCQRARFCLGGAGKLSRAVLPARCILECWTVWEHVGVQRLPERGDHANSEPASLPEHHIVGMTPSPF